MEALRKRLGDLFPAWAGVILWVFQRERERGTFPRVGGGDPASSEYQSMVPDFSPRGRG